MPVLCGVWLLGLATSFGALAFYKATPSPHGLAPVVFPAGSSLRRANDRPTLLMFVHPRCACSRASLAELGKLLQPLRDPVDVTVIVRTDAPDEEATLAAPLVAQARALPGIQVRFDPGGVEAARFGAESSGHVVLYAAHGELRYAGGLTNSRGHEGPSLGQTYLATALSDASLAVRTAPVFGCELTERRAE